MRAVIQDGNIYVKRVVIGYIYSKSTHIWYCITVWDELQGKISGWSKAGGRHWLEPKMTLKQHLGVSTFATNPSTVSQPGQNSCCGDSLETWRSTWHTRPEPSFRVGMKTTIYLSWWEFLLVVVEGEELIGTVPVPVPINKLAPPTLTLSFFQKKIFSCLLFLLLAVYYVASFFNQQHLKLLFCER